MGYNRENYRRIRHEFESKYKIARDDADRRCAEVWAVIPGVRDIDAQLSRAGLEIMRAITAGGQERENISAMIDRVRERNEALQSRRRELLLAHGYPEDYTDVRYDCPNCGDSGYIDGIMCDCMKRELVYAGCESSGIGRLMREQNFENFTLDYYRTNTVTYEEMERVLTTAYRFANGFTENSGVNLVFIGGTGLGKTHLSSAIARRVIERGFDVVYVSAQSLISDFERERFGNSSTGTGVGDTARYTECDLLIIDDLGTEVTNQFTVACLYNVINTRLNLCRSTLISANLNQNELRSRYTDRIASRLFGEYRVLRFVGTDVRAQKLSGK